MNRLKYGSSYFVKMNRVKHVPDHRIDKVVMPHATFGSCVIGNCRKVDWLADGYCVDHWDKTTAYKP